MHIRGNQVFHTGLAFTVAGAIVLPAPALVLLRVVDEPLAAPIATLPLVLIHRALSVPQLADQAVRDSKTNLLNPRGLEEAVRKELERAVRFGGPLSLLLVDLDVLRGINNRYGHLTGDRALRTVADVLRVEARLSPQHCATHAPAQR